MNINWIWNQFDINSPSCSASSPFLLFRKGLEFSEKSSTKYLWESHDIRMRSSEVYHSLLMSSVETTATTKKNIAYGKDLIFRCSRNSSSPRAWSWDATSNGKNAPPYKSIPNFYFLNLKTSVYTELQSLGKIVLMNSLSIRICKVDSMGTMPSILFTVLFYSVVGFHELFSQPLAT